MMTVNQRRRTNKVFDFDQQFSQSTEAVKRMGLWLRTRADVECVVDIQADWKRSGKQGDLSVWMKRGFEPFHFNVEVKSESRESTQTENLAIEVWSNRDKGVPGGPWASEAHSYVHVYADGMAVQMNRVSLIAWLKDTYASYDTFSAQNLSAKGIRYTSVGILVPRWSLLEGIGSKVRIDMLPPIGSYTRSIFSLNEFNSHVDKSMFWIKRNVDAKKPIRPSRKKQDDDIDRPKPTEYIEHHDAD